MKPPKYVREMRKWSNIFIYTTIILFFVCSLLLPSAAWTLYQNDVFCLVMFFSLIAAYIVRRIALTKEDKFNDLIYDAKMAGVSPATYALRSIPNPYHDMVVEARRKGLVSQCLRSIPPYANVDAMDAYVIMEEWGK